MNVRAKAGQSDRARSCAYPYEPPLSVRGSAPTAWLPRFYWEVAAGNIAAATVTDLKGARLDPVLARLPRWLLTRVAAVG
jgi:hypothetical protein